MKRVLACILMLLCAAQVIVLPVGANETAERTRKVVSVLYDDSGSMFNRDEKDEAGNDIKVPTPKWAYASYAMQSFCSLMNEDDVLYITYMSEYENAMTAKRPSLSNDDIQESVDDIRNYYESGGTPFNAIKNGAFACLEDYADEHGSENVEYWLVVITDGEMYADGIRKAKEDLDKTLRECSNTDLEGARAKITFFAINDGTGDSEKFPVPDEDPERGIRVENIDSAEEIVETMAKIANEVSGRTQLDSEAVEKTDRDNVVKITSTVPLLSISVLAQDGAGIKSAKCGDEQLELSLTRSVSIKAPEPDEKHKLSVDSLSGSAFVLSGGDEAIPAGDYFLEFEQAADPDNITVMFEPALEIRLELTCNGETVEDVSKLNEAFAQDTLGAKCKIYQTGTDIEIPFDALPEGSECTVGLYEQEGDEFERRKTASDSDGIVDYSLNSVPTLVKGELKLAGFDKIDSSYEFTPQEYVAPPIVYTVSGEQANGVGSINIEQIATNDTLSAVFTVYADGEAMTDPEAVKALAPQVTVTPDGNSGKTEITDEGKVVFTPNAAAGDGDAFKVSVTCTVADATATVEYTVLTSDYAVVAAGADGSVRKNEFFGNTLGASFYIMRDGSRLSKSEIGADLSVSLNDAYSHLTADITVDEDGTVHVVPHDPEEHKITFASWLFNWVYYFRLPGEDVSITLDHTVGSAAQSIEVGGATVKYLILFVILPIIACILLVLYIIRTVTKPRFSKEGVLYVGTLRWQTRGSCHKLEMSVGYELRKFNTIFNRLNPFDTASGRIDGHEIRVVAKRGGEVLIVNSGGKPNLAWFSTSIKPVDVFIKMKSVRDVVTHCDKKRYLEIKEVTSSDLEVKDFNTISQNSEKFYVINPETERVRSNGGDRRVIKSATVICYSI